MRSFDTPMPDLNGRSILVTGGTGSFGNAIVRTILERWVPRKVIVFSRDELKQWEMSHKDWIKGRRGIRFFIGDVRDVDRLEMAFRGVDYVIHTAALKHVPAAEYNPFECIHTNVLGAENVVRAAIRANVKKVIALSTDKAANPANLYGASKLASDKIFIAANSLAGADGCRFAVVRYGNVVGSRGSVVPFFKSLRDQGADRLPITDPRMTRFWITLKQGVNFVLNSLEMMRGGEIYIPKIPSMLITNLAECICPGVPHETIGIRPGEKLHEVMVTKEDAYHTLEFGNGYVIAPAFPFWTGEHLSGDGFEPVSENFSYASDTNQEWLGIEEMSHLVEDV